MTFVSRAITLAQPLEGMLLLDLGPITLLMTSQFLQIEMPSALKRASSLWVASNTNWLSIVAIIIIMEE